MNGENKKTILLVEDEAIVAMTEKMALEKHGYSVITVTTGEEAVEAVNSIPEIDLILMDIDLGKGIDGTEAAERILKDRDLPILFLSNHTEPKIVEKTEKITSYGYVVKSSSITVLDASIKMAFKLFDANSALRESEEKYRVAFAISPNSININSMKGLYIDINEGFTKLTGYTRQDVIGVLSSEIKIWYIPEDRDKLIEGLTKNGSVDYLESVFQCKDGTLKNAVMSARIIKINKVPHILSITRDITEAKQAEEIIKTKNKDLERSNEELTAAMEEMEAGNEELIQVNRELYEARDALKVAEETYRNIFLNAQVGLFRTDINTGLIIDANDTVAHFAGYQSREEMLSTPFNIAERYVDSKDREKLISLLNKHGQITDFETDFRKNDGSIIRLRFSGKLVHDKGWMEGVSEDITEQKRWEQKLIESEEKARQITEYSADAIFTVSKDGKYTYVNKTACDMLGYTENELLSLSIPDVSYSGRLETFNNLKEKGHIFTEMELKCKDGSPVSVDMNAVILPDGTAYASCRNITKRKQAEEEIKSQNTLLSLIMETSPVGIATVDAEGSITYANYRAEQILGIAKSKITARKYDSPEWRHTDIEGGPFPDEKQPFYIVKTTGKTAYNIQHGITWPDGRSVMLSINASPMRDKDGQFAGMVATFEDVTDKLRNEKTIIRQLSEKELLLKEVHHRIKNNMATMTSMLSLQANMLEEPTAIKALQDAGCRIHSMEVLYDKLYRSENLQAMSLKVYLSSLVDDVVGIFPHSTSVKIEKRIDEVVLDVKRIQPLGIIINELLTNIMKYAFIGREEGLITISVSEKDNHVSFIIEDNGIGMPESIDFKNSTGFGLMLVEILTKQLSGTIRFERSKGTKVVLEFKL